MTDWIALFVVVLLALGALFLFARRRDGRTGQQGLPAEHFGAELAYAETTFKSVRLALVARLDRAYRTRDGIVLVELKTRRRNRPFPSDVIELSVQRVALQDATGEPVSSTAWVLVDRNGSRQSHRVNLLSTEKVERLRARYDDLARGDAARPKPARTMSQCANCGHRQRCAAKFGDRG